MTEYPNGKFATLARNRQKKLQKGQTMANVPPPETSIVVAEPTEIVIRADDDWVNSGITVDRGKTYHFVDVTPDAIRLICVQELGSAARLILIPLAYAFYWIFRPIVPTIIFVARVRQ